MRSGRRRRRGRGSARPPVRSWVAALLLLGLLGAGAVALWPTRALEGVDYELQEVRLPRYVKGLHFLSRHHQTRALASAITVDAATPEERAVRVFRWVSEEIHPVPAGFPVVDDHPVNIAIRRYGTEDQVADLMATLLVYSGERATVHLLRPPEEEGWIAMVAVLLEGEWRLFDPARRLLFTSTGRPGITPARLRSDPEGALESLGVSLEELPLSGGIPYLRYLEGAGEVEVGDFVRGELHAPIPRLRYEVLRAMRRTEAPGWASGGDP